MPQKLTEDQRNDCLAAGEYCGNYGHIPESTKEYESMKRRAWFCSVACDKEANERV